MATGFFIVLLVLSNLLFAYDRWRMIKRLEKAHEDWMALRRLNYQLKRQLGQTTSSIPPSGKRS